MEVGGGGGEREIVYVSLHCHHHPSLSTIYTALGFSWQPLRSPLSLATLYQGKCERGVGWRGDQIEYLLRNVCGYVDGSLI